MVDHLETWTGLAPQIAWSLGLFCEVRPRDAGIHSRHWSKGVSQLGCAHRAEIHDGEIHQEMKRHRWIIAEILTHLAEALSLEDHGLIPTPCMRGNDPLRELLLHVFGELLCAVHDDK